MTENIVLIASLVSILLAIIMGYTLKHSKLEFFKTHKKKLEISFIYVPIALAFLLLIYDSSDTLFDYIYVIFIFTVLVWLAFVFEKKININNYKLRLVFHFIMYIVLFFVVRDTNRHLILPMAHNWIIILLILNLKQIFRKDEKNGSSTFLADILGIIALFIMFNIFSEPFDGISKQEYIVKTYLIEEKGYKENDIIELSRLTFSEEDEKRVFVSVKDNSVENRDRKAYIFHYKGGNIIKIKELDN